MLNALPGEDVETEMMKQVEELYDKYSRRIFNYFYYLTCDSHRAGDLTQETFYQVILSIVRFKEESKVSTWIYGIARNTYLKSLRKEKRVQVEADESLFDRNDKSFTYTPEEMLEKKETLKSIASVLNRLPEKYSTVLILRDREGLSYNDIARIAGMSEAQVKVTLFRARRKFREEYKKIERSGEP